MQIDPTFRAYVDHLDLNALTQSEDVVYVVDEQMNLKAYNPAWETFALNNNGASVLEKYPLGKSITAAFPEKIRTHYVNGYSQALKTGDRFDQDYECSSPNQYRLFHQIAYPLPAGRGLVITNHLVVTGEINRMKYAFGPKYRNADGFVVQCCHCRTVKNQADPERWDWVPSLVEHPDIKTLHSVCANCLDQYFPDLI
ncbi:MAG: hypothetical protein HGA76_01515 [Candidatus Firestonebacteria bacterium]|nr:hypothetical protein [Candidatus Firestonebacteria bacterium]